MKKLTIPLVLLLTASLAHADTISWRLADQVKIAWDETTQMANGDPVPADGEITYEIVIAGVDKAKTKVLWTGSENSATVTIPEYGRYLFGVKGMLTIDGEIVAESEYSWSDNPEAVSDGLFGVLFYAPLESITGLKKVE